MKFLILIYVFMISACGMQGDLYLPEDKSSQDVPRQESSTQNENKGS